MSLVRGENKVKIKPENQGSIAIPIPWVGTRGTNLSRLLSGCSHSLGGVARHEQQRAVQQGSAALSERVQEAIDVAAKRGGGGVHLVLGNAQRLRARKGAQSTPLPSSTPTPTLPSNRPARH